MSPRVSIITPTYNHERFIGDCIRSVLAQTVTDWEMILVDDGSTDRTAQIIDEFRDPRIRCFRQKNAGIEHLNLTYNRALAEARGEVIAILEGDDYWPPDKLENQLSDFDQADVVLSSGLTAVDRGDGFEMKTIPAESPPDDARKNRPVGRAAKHMVRQQSLTYTFPVSTMIRAAALRKIGGFQQPPYLLVVDFPTFLRLTLEGEFRFHDRILGYWRRHGGSMTFSRMSQIQEGAYRYAFEFLREFRDKLPLTDDELDDIQEHWDKVQAMNCILRGRMLSKLGKHKVAAKSFRQAGLYNLSGRSRFISTAAAMFASLGIPVEPLYRLTGRVPLDEAMTIDTGDSIVSEEDLERDRFVGRWRR